MFILKNFNKKYSSGFTLIESLLSITILGLIVFISVPFLQSFQVKNELEITTNILTQNLRNAQIYTRAVKEDDDWGVKINTGNLILFKGGDYVSRDISFDEQFEISSSISLSGDNEIIFNKFTGLPNTSYNTTLTSSEGINKNISINEKGTISY